MDILDLANKLKFIKTVKEKKWMYNLIANILRMIDRGESYQRILMTINSYYLHHFKGYYNNRYQKSRNCF